MKTPRAIRVLIIDDSAVIRNLLTDILSSDNDIEVVGTAMNPYIAREKIKRLNPDVLTLDIEMPKMNGIDFLKNLMRLRPMPVLMVSSLTQRGADIALEALGLGAVDYVAKPTAQSKSDLAAYAREIIAKIKVAAASNIAKKPAPRDSSQSSTDITASNTSLSQDCVHAIIAIGASTGGTEAIKDILCAMQPDAYSIVIVQHIPKAFSKPFADRINSLSALEVSEATDGQTISPGGVYIAPGDQHLTIVRRNDTYFCKLDDSAACNRHKPSVDVLFSSIANIVGDNAIGVLLTGMGSDGAKGLEKIHRAGAITIAQDQNSSVVWGMPGEAVRLKAADYVLPLHQIPGKLASIIEHCKQSRQE